MSEYRKLQNKCKKIRDKYNLDIKLNVSTEELS